MFNDGIGSLQHESYFNVLVRIRHPYSKPVTIFFLAEVSDQVETNTDNYADPFASNLPSLDPLISATLASRAARIMAKHGHLINLLT